MRIAVFAYHNIGYECLKVLIEGNEEIVAVVTHEDDPTEEIWFPSVSQLARSHGLPVFTPSNPNTPPFVDLIRTLGPDLILSFYYRRLLGNELLAVPRLGGINLHGSLLPRYRGRAPVNWALVNGETETGVTLHDMVEKADAGDIIAQRPVPIWLEDTALSLYRKLSAAAVELLKETYPLIKAGTVRREPQNPGLATTFGRRRPEDGRVNWESSALSIYNLIRAVTHPFPGAFTFYGERKLYLWQADCRISVDNRGLPGTVQAVGNGRGLVVSTGQGRLVLTRVQFDGEGEIPADRLVERYSMPNGSRLG